MCGISGTGHGSYLEDFPAFILVDDKGNDFFKQLKPWNCTK